MGACVDTVISAMQLTLYATTSPYTMAFVPPLAIIILADTIHQSIAWISGITFFVVGFIEEWNYCKKYNLWNQHT